MPSWDELSIAPATPTTAAPSWDDLDWFDGDSWFEWGMDVINTPQQMLFGALTKGQSESIWDAMERGAKTNISGPEVVQQLSGNQQRTALDTAAGTMMQFVVDPLNAIPGAVFTKLFKPLGKGVSLIAKPVGKFLGQFETWRNIAQKFAKTAYAGANEKRWLESFHYAMEKLGIQESDLLQDIATGEGAKLKQLAQTWGKQYGYKPQDVERMIRQIAEHKVLSPLDIRQTGFREFTDAKGEQDVTKITRDFTQHGAAGPYMEHPAALAAPKISKLLQKELTLPGDARYLFDKDILDQLVKDKLVFVPKHSTPDLVEEILPDGMEIYQDAHGVFHAAIQETSDLFTISKGPQIIASGASREEVFNKVQQLSASRFRYAGPSMAGGFKAEDLFTGEVFPIQVGSESEALSMIDKLNQRFSQLKNYSKPGPRGTMTLQHYEYIPETVVKQNGQDVTVKGVVLNRLTGQVVRHGATLEEFEQHAKHVVDEIDLGKLSDPSPLPLTEIPVVRYQRSAEGIPEFSDIRHATFYKDARHPYANLYQEGKFAPEGVDVGIGGQNKVELTVSPQKPLVVAGNTLAGPGALAKFYGDDALEVFNRAVAQENLNPLKRALRMEGITEQTSPAVFHEMDDAMAQYQSIKAQAKIRNLTDVEFYQLEHLQARMYFAAVDTLGVHLAKKHGFDSIITLANDGLTFNEVVMVNTLEDQVKRGVLPHVLDEIENYDAISKFLPIKVPTAVVQAALGVNKRMEDIFFLEKSIGAGTPELEDIYHDYLFHMVTKDAKKLLGKLFQPKFGIKKFSLAHQSMLARSLRGHSIDEVNEMAKAGTLVIDGQRIQVDKFFEDSLESIEYFRAMRALRLKTNIDLLHDAASYAAIDARQIANRLNKERREILQGAEAFDETMAGLVKEGQLTEQEYYDAVSQYRLQAGLIPGETLKDAVRKEIPEGYVKLSFVKSKDPRYQNLIPYFKDLYFDPDVAKHINGMMEFNLNPETMGDFHQLLEKFRQNWVIGTLFGFPSTWVKNFVGNIFNSYLEGLTFKNFGWYETMRKVQKAMNTGKLDEMIELPSGETRAAKDLMAEMKDMAVVGSGFSAEVTKLRGRLFKEPAILRIPEKIPVAKLGSKWLRTGQRWYQNIEDMSRGALYLYKRYGEKLDPFSARGVVKKNLFDYVYGLTDFERKIRLFIPFYAWIRNNLPLQIRTLIENPLNTGYIRLAEFTSLVRDNQAAREVDEFHRSVLPDFVREQVGIPVRTSEDGNPEYFMFGSWVPAAELESLFHPLRKAMSAFAPYFKIPIEQVFNYDSFIDRKIEEFPGETQKYAGIDVRRRLVHFSKLFRFVNEFHKLTEGALNQELDPSTQELWKQVMTRLFVGGGSVPINLEYGESKRISKIKDAERRLRYEDSEADIQALLEYIEELTEDE